MVVSCFYSNAKFSVILVNYTISALNGFSSVRAAGYGAIFQKYQLILVEQLEG